MARGRTYSDKLRDPRWQKRRLKILERDGWRCRSCGDDTETLHVHHRWYEKGKEPWESPDDGLVTLCDECHAVESEERPVWEAGLIAHLRRHLLAFELNMLAGVIESMPPDVLCALSESPVLPGKLEVVERWMRAERERSTLRREGRGDG